MGKLKRLEISNADFNGIKKNKKVVLLLPEMEETTDIHAKDKIILTNRVTGKKIKKKVKSVLKYDDLDTALESTKKAKLGLKKGETFNRDEFLKSHSSHDLKKSGIVAIEVKPRLTFMRVLLVLLCIVLGVMLCFKLDTILKKANVEKVSKQISSIYEEKKGLVFLEINPSLALETRGNEVVGVACLNEDCMKMYEDIDIIGKNIENSIEAIYNVAKDNGFDISKGVRVKSSETVEITEIPDYVSIEYISSVEESQLIEKVINKDNLTLENNDDYYTKLWENLKKDTQYDKAYTCEMVEDKLECHFLEQYIRPIDGILDGSAPMTKALQILFFNQLTGIKNTLDKFNIPNTFGQYAANMGDDTNQIILNGVKYQYVLDYSHNGYGIKNACYYRAKIKGECIEEFGICDYRYEEKAFSILDMDLLNPTAVLGKLRVNDLS